MERAKGKGFHLVMSRRHLLIGTAALAVVAAGGLGYYFASGSKPGAPRPAPGGGGTADLMAAGPLSEQVLGDANAPVTIIEYASMTCPHCAHFHETTYPELKKRYIDTGKVKFIFREFPLDQLAAAAFMLARCAGSDNYFPMIETLFQQQRDWAVQNPVPPLFGVAKQAGFTQQKFEECLTNQKLLEDIETVRNRGAEKYGVNSTPTFFINGKIFRGALTIEEIDKEIQPYLKSS